MEDSGFEGERLPGQDLAGSQCTKEGEVVEHRGLGTVGYAGRHGEFSSLEGEANRTPYLTGSTVIARVCLVDNLKGVGLELGRSSTYVFIQD